MEESILRSIRSMIGPSADYSIFDTDLIFWINSAFSTLYQLGIGVDKDHAFFINDENSTWADFIGDDANSSRLNLVKTYIYMKVKMGFDPPASSQVMESMKTLCEEYEYRMKMAEELPVLGGISPKYRADDYYYDEKQKAWVDGE